MFAIAIGIGGMFLSSYLTNRNHPVGFATLLGAIFGFEFFFMGGSYDLFFMHRIHKGSVEDISSNTDAIGFEVIDGATANGSVSWFTQGSEADKEAQSIRYNWDSYISPLLKQKTSADDDNNIVYGWLACAMSPASPVKRDCSVRNLGPNINLLRATGPGLLGVQKFLVEKSGLPLSTFQGPPIFYPVESVSETLFDRRLMITVFILSQIVFFGGIFWLRESQK